MPMRYKIDVMKALADAGYNTNTIRKNNLLAQSTLQKLRESKPISWANIETLCRLLHCQPGDIIEYIPEK